MKKYIAPIMMWLLFEIIAVTLWLSLNNIFYLFNFSYIGTCLSIGIFLYTKKRILQLQDPFLFSFQISIRNG